MISRISTDSIGIYADITLGKNSYYAVYPFENNEDTKEDVRSLHM